MKKLIALIKEHQEELRIMEAIALKQYGGLGALKYIDKVEVSGDTFRGLVKRFGEVVASIPKPKKKTTKKKVETKD